MTKKEYKFQHRASRKETTIVPTGKLPPLYGIKKEKEADSHEYVLL
jgi:hypothetical protein